MLGVSQSRGLKPNFQQPVTQRNATQRKDFSVYKRRYVKKSVSQRTASALRCTATFRKKIETSSIFPQRRKRRRPITEGGAMYQSQKPFNRMQGWQVFTTKSVFWT